MGAPGWWDTRPVPHLGFCPLQALSKLGFFKKEIQLELPFLSPGHPTPTPVTSIKKPLLPGGAGREDFSKGCMCVLLGAASVSVNSRSRHSLTNGRKFGTWA